MSKIISLLSSSNYVVVNKIVMCKIGIYEAILIGELCGEYNYFADKNQLTDDGYFYSTGENITKNTGLSERQQRNAINKLVELGILSIDFRDLPRKKYFCINENALENFLFEGIETSKPQDKSLQNRGTCIDKTAGLGPTKPQVNNNNKDYINNNNKKEIITEEEFRELSDSKISKRNYTKTTPREDVIEDNKQTREEKILGIIHKSDLEKSIQDALVTFYYNCIAKVERKGIKIASETTKYNLSPDRIANIIANIKLQMQMHKYTDKDILESVLFSGDNGYAKIVFPHERFSNKPKNESHTGNNTKVVYTEEELAIADEKGRKLEEQMKKDGTWREYY